MAKTKKPEEKSTIAPAPPTAESPAPSPPIERSARAFPTKVKCPLCGTAATRAYSTQGTVQYRKCMICRHKFKIGCAGPK